jgi:chorismate mutase
MGVEGFDIMEAEAAEEVIQRLTAEAEAGGFAGEAVEANERDVIRERLNRSLNLVGITDASGEIVGQ